MGVRQGYPIISTTTIKEAGIHGLQTIIKKKVKRMQKTTEKAVLDQMRDKINGLSASTDYKTHVMKFTENC